MDTMKLHVEEHEEEERSHCRLPKLSIFAHGVIYINQFAELKDKRKPGKQSKVLRGGETPALCVMLHGRRCQSSLSHPAASLLPAVSSTGSSRTPGKPAPPKARYQGNHWLENTYF